MHFDSIIIGAGNGGLSAATRLATKGQKVLVLERHNVPGGCGTSFRRGRFEFEVALHQLSSMGSTEKPGDLRKLFSEYGIEDKIDWIEIESLYKVVLPSGFTCALPTNRVDAQNHLIEKFPHEKANILRYYEVVYSFFDESEDFAKVQANSTGEPSDLKKFVVSKLFSKKYPTLAKYAMRSTQDVMDEFFKTKELQLCLNTYWCFMGMPPERFPFSILAKCTRIYIEDKPYYLRGGSQVISQALVESIKENDGIVKLSCGVKQIIVKNKKAVGVIDEFGNEYTCDNVISNASPIDTYFKLLDKKDLPQSAIDQYRQYTVGISALTCFIGLDCPPDEIGFTDSFNLIYEDDDCNNAFKNAYELMPTTDPLVTTCYTVDDPKVSPEGTSVITAGTLKYGKAWMELAEDEYYDTKYKACDIIIERLEKKFKGIRSHIEEIEIATPLTHMHYLHHPEGSIYGFEQDLNQSVFFFPREDQIENLTFANGWVNVCGFGPNYLYGATVADGILKGAK